MEVNIDDRRFSLEGLDLKAVRELSAGVARDYNEGVWDSSYDGMVENAQELCEFFVTHGEFEGEFSTAATHLVEVLSDVYVKREELDKLMKLMRSVTGEKYLPKSPQEKRADQVDQVSEYLKSVGVRMKDFFAKHLKAKGNSSEETPAA